MGSLVSFSLLRYPLTAALKAAESTSGCSRMQPDSISSMPAYYNLLYKGESVPRYTAKCIGEYKVNAADRA
jgi:hypothetical protein